MDAACPSAVFAGALRPAHEVNRDKKGETGQWAGLCTVAMGYKCIVVARPFSISSFRF